MKNLHPNVRTKLEELCQSILEQPDFEQWRLRVDQFLVNDEARAQYVAVSERGEHLHHKQTQGLELPPDEIAQFEAERERLLANPVARGFLDAQEALQEVRDGINQFVGKTLELGRLPDGEELSGGGCGQGCGCHGS
ncbi:MAG: YlbF family regulator [Verrucomicrobiae bacterium]|nr:YlbF family regulator [Verrucomicrobiae bacterium]